MSRTLSVTPSLHGVQFIVRDGSKVIMQGSCGKTFWDGPGHRFAYAILADGQEPAKIDCDFRGGHYPLVRTPARTGCLRCNKWL